MKKISVFLFTFLFSLLFLHGQEDTVKIYETFTWDAVSSARKYEVIIEKETDEGWIPYYSTIVKDCSFEYAMEPASYRICVVSINALGRKSKDNAWLKFKIIDDKIPYLYNNYYEKNVRWNSPVLYINNSGLPVPGNEIFITPEEGILYLKGKNIFYEGTEFNLIPIEKSLFQGKDYPEKTSERNTVPLTIVQRNSKKDLVIVSYDSEKLVSGYYKVEAKNPGGYTSAISILVLVNEKLRISPVEMKVDSTYKLPVAKINNAEDELAINLLGKGIGAETKFYLEPISSSVVYPYESKEERTTVPLIKDEKAESDNSSDTYSLKAEDIKLVKSGFYNVVAETADGQKESFPVLIEPDFNKEHESSVDKISVKKTKKDMSLDLTINGSNLDESYKYTLVSQYYDDIQGNYSLELKPKITEDKTKLTQTIPLSELPIGKYVLMVESPEDIYPVYLEIDENLNGRKLNVENPESVEWLKTTEKKSQFVVENKKPDEKPIEIIDENSSDKKDEIIEEKSEEKTVEFIKESEIPEENVLTRDTIIKPLHYQILEIPPFFFPRMHFTGGVFANDRIADYNLEVQTDIFNINWFALDFALRFDAGYFEDVKFSGGIKYFTNLNAEFSGNLIWPLGYIKPYIGFGFGATILDMVQYENQPWDVYSSLKFGVMAFDFLEFRYSLEFHDILSSSIHLGSLFSIGITIGIQKPKYENGISLKEVVFTKGSEVKGSEYQNDINEIEIVRFGEKVEKVSEFIKAENLEKVFLSSSIKEISDNTFRTCLNLTQVNIPEDTCLKKIGAASFANDSSILKINIPKTVTEIGTNAFANWTEGQQIILGWDSSDTTERKLDGLETTEATIIYADGKLFKNSYIEPWENPENWKMLEISPEFIFFELNGKNKRGLEFVFDETMDFAGYRKSNVTASQEMLEELKTAKGIEFKCKSLKYDVPDNNTKYKMVITTESDEEFEYPFISYNPIMEKSIGTSYRILFTEFSIGSGYNFKRFPSNKKVKNIYILPEIQSKKVNAETEVEKEDEEEPEKNYRLVIYDIKLIK